MKLLLLKEQQLLVNREKSNKEIKQRIAIKKESQEDEEQYMYKKQRKTF